MSRHAAYLASPAWAAKRAEYRRYRKWQCRLCGVKRGGIQLHHLTYERLGHEDLDDLIPLCAGCHMLVHAHCAEHPDLSLRAATLSCLKKYRSLREVEKRKVAATRARRKARRRADRPQTDWVDRFGAKTIRIDPKQRESTRNAGATGTS